MDINITIGPARVREAEYILKLQYLCYQSEAALYDDYTIEPLTQTLADLLASYDTHAILGERLMQALEAQAATDRYELFTGHRSEDNLRLYRRLGYTVVREDAVAPHVHLVYLEKHHTAS